MSARLILILFLFPFYAQGQTKGYKPYHSIQLNWLSGNDYTAAGYNGYGLTYFLHAYMNPAMIPGIGLANLTYVSDGIRKKALVTELFGRLNFEFKNGLNLRLTASGGTHKLSQEIWTPNGIEHKEAYKFASSAMLGLGASFWRLKANIDIGSSMYFMNRCFASSVNVAYIFSKNKDLKAH